jgi:hypothetical protein
VTGKNADERNKSGMMTRFMISGNDWKSVIFDARINPKPTAAIAINIINVRVSIKPGMLEIGVPRNTAINKMMKP